MPGSERQNNMFEASPLDFKIDHPFKVTSCGRRRNKGQSIFKKLRKTTKGKGRHFLTAPPFLYIFPPFIPISGE